MKETNKSDVPIQTEYLDEVELEISYPFPCDMCDESFPTRDDRNTHIANHFKEFDCPKCKKSFLGDRQFEYHQLAGRCRQSESPTSPKETDATDIPRTGLECPTCSMANFQSMRSLRIHIGRFHVEKKKKGTERKYACHICEKEFANQHILKNHVSEIHTNAQQHECKQCGRLFNRLANLRHHELIHKEELPCKCTVCGKAFRTSSGVRLHLRTHTGDKPYSCEICNVKSYAYNTDLQRHKRSAHNIIGKRYRCTICENIYYERKHVRNHVRRQHNQEDAFEEVIASDIET